MASLLLRNRLYGAPVGMLEQAVSLREWLNDGWGLLLSDSRYFAPARFAARGGLARLRAELARRNVRIISVADNPYENEQDWIALINDNEPCVFLSSGRSPLDSLDGGEAALAERILQGELESLVRPYMVVVDGQARSRAAINYREGVSLDFSEVLRVVDLLQAQDETHTRPSISPQAHRTTAPPFAMD